MARTRISGIRSYSPKDRGFTRRTPYTGSQTDRAPLRDNKTSPITVNATGSRRTVSHKYPVRKDAARYSEYTPLTTPIARIFDIGEKSGIFCKPIRTGPPGRKDLGRYCAFHDANEHETMECRHLRGHIKDLIRKGFLTEFVAEEAKKYKADKADKEGDKANAVRMVRARSIPYHHWGSLYWRFKPEIQ